MSEFTLKVIGGKVNLYYIEWENEEFIVVAPSRENAIFTISEFKSTFDPRDAKIALGKENPRSFLIIGGRMVFFPDDNLIQKRK